MRRLRKARRAALLQGDEVRLQRAAEEEQHVDLPAQRLVERVLHLRAKTTEARCVSERTRQCLECPGAFWVVFGAREVVEVPRSPVKWITLNLSQASAVDTI